MKPHMPSYAPKKYWDLYERDKIQTAVNRTRPAKAPKLLTGSGEFRSYHLADYDENSEDFHRMMRHGYLACTSYVDKLVGDVLAELNRLDLAENTVVVLWGDHGWHLGEHNFWGKHNTMHLSTRVPLILKVPGKKPGNTSSLVETSDIFPTLCAIAGMDLDLPVTQSATTPEARVQQIPGRDRPLVDHAAALESGKRLEQAMANLSPRLRLAAVRAGCVSPPVFSPSG